MTPNQKKSLRSVSLRRGPHAEQLGLQEPASPLGRPRIAVVATGSVASVKIPELVEKLSEIAEVTVLLTAPAEVMTSQQVAGRYSPERYRAWEALQRSGVHVLRDIDEWDGYEDVSSDSVVHIELREMGRRSAGGAMLCKHPGKTGLGAL